MKASKVIALYRQGLLGEVEASEALDEVMEFDSLSECCGATINDFGYCVACKEHAA